DAVNPFPAAAPCVINLYSKRHAVAARPERRVADIFVGIAAWCRLDSVCSQAIEDLLGDIESCHCVLPFALLLLVKRATRVVQWLCLKLSTIGLPTTYAARSATSNSWPSSFSIFTRSKRLTHRYTVERTGIRSGISPLAIC